MPFAFLAVLLASVMTPAQAFFFNQARLGLEVGGRTWGGRGEVGVGGGEVGGEVGYLGVDWG